MRVAGAFLGVTGGCAFLLVVVAFFAAAGNGALLGPAGEVDLDPAGDIDLGPAGDGDLAPTGDGDLRRGWGTA